MQDPTDPDTEYLYEAIIGQAVEASKWQGMYAFATRGGVDQLIEDPVLEEFLKRGGDIDLIVGIDAVTNRATLERLQELEHHHKRFRPRVFWNETAGLFHPKISRFTFDDGRETLIVGSGNLTPGGLTHNYEGYCIATADEEAPLDMSSLDDFLERQKKNIRPIDAEALERAAKNIAKPIKGAKPKIPAVKKKPTLVSAKAVETAPQFDRFLIAQVPEAGGRWSQAHFNAAVIDKFFRITDREKQRVFLTQVDQSCQRSEEEVRKVIYSTSNKNYKIELRAAKHLEYPEESAPVVVMRERQVRAFDYMLLMPGDPGYDKMLDLTTTLPKVGKGHPRIITDRATVAASWPNCPLLLEDEELDKEL